MSPVLGQVPGEPSGGISHGRVCRFPGLWWMKRSGSRCSQVLSWLQARCVFIEVCMNPFWINSEGVRLAITPRPRGEDWLEDDIRLLQRAGIDVVVSALTQVEAEELGLLREGQCCQNNGLEFHSFPI